MACLRKLAILLSVLLLANVSLSSAKEDDGEEKDKWKKKHITDYTEADLEKLYEQWEDADEDKLEDDELPEWKRPQPQIDLSKLNPNDPEGMLKMTKTGRTLMMFATVSGNPTEKQTEQVTQLWHTGLFNAHYDTQRYVVGSDRVLFVLKDGSQAWDVKDYLVRQDRCELVTIENKDYPGKASPQYVEEGSGANKKSKIDGKSKKKNTKESERRKKNEL